MKNGKVRIGIIGCGFTADLYWSGLRFYPNLDLVGATDILPDRTAKFCNFSSSQNYPTLENMLADSSIEMIVNLTNSSSHYTTTKQCLEAGKHVYSDKPLALKFSDAEELAQLAKSKGLHLSSAPCGLLGETAQTLWRALRKNEIGPIRLVYAELDDGPLNLQMPHTWRSPFSESPFDYHAEFGAGVTIEHSFYYLTWLVAFFGPAKTVTAFSDVLWPERHISPEETMKITTPDLAVACIRFESGVVARFTCGLIAPYNHLMQIVGETGVLSVREPWNLSSPVYIDRYSQKRFKAERYAITKSFPFLAKALSRGSGVYPPVRKASFRQRAHKGRPDFMRGVAELGRAIREDRESRLPLDFCLHVNELGLAIQHPNGNPYSLKTSFKPLSPLEDDEMKEVFPPANW
jgi:predicted dehydrogenase